MGATTRGDPEMTTPKIATIRRGGARHYVHPVDGSTAVGVTSVVGMLPKDFLRYWAAKLVAESAYDEFSTLAGFVVSEDPESRAAAVAWLKNAPTRLTSGAAQNGNDVHSLTEDIDRLGGIPPRLPADKMPYALGWLNFREQTQCEVLAAERTIWNSGVGYSGTLDRSVLIPASAWERFDAPPAWWEGPDVPIICDCKTTRSGVFPEVGLQMAAYSYATESLEFDEHGVAEAKPWPKHSETSLVVWLRPEAWRLTPVDSSAEVFEAFKHLAAIFKFDRGLKKDLILPDVAGETWEPEQVALFADVLRGLRK